MLVQLELNEDILAHVSVDVGHVLIVLVLLELNEDILAHVSIDLGQVLVLLELNEDILSHVSVDVGQVVVDALLLNKYPVEAASKELPP